jgi:TatD DNase family protein
MRFSDTHCHLYLNDFENDISIVIRRARDAGVIACYLPNIDSSSIADMLRLEAGFPGFCHAMMGLHPCSVKENYKDELALVKDWLSKRPFAAVGEIGLDFHWDKTFVPQQYEAFRLQIRWAREIQLPIVIHSRDSIQECIDVVKENQDGDLKGIFHCFTGSYESALRIIDLGFYLGIGGVLTYKNSGLEETISKIDLKHIVLETDAPYLTPVPFRGKRNESAYLKYVLEKLSEIKGIPASEIADITTENSNMIFNTKSV